MLLQFVVENFLSFRDKAVLSMLAPEGTPHDEARHLRVEGLPPVLKCAAIYGANASGKSNLVKAFEFARRLVTYGTKAGDRLPLPRFKLDSASLSEPSRFEIDIYTGGRRYAYGFVATPEIVESEWLFVNDGGGEQAIFERQGSDMVADRPPITLGAAFTLDPARRRFVEFVAEGTRKNQLFLTEAAERNVGELEVVMSWFRWGSVALMPGTRFDPLFDAARLEGDAAFRDYVGDLLQRAGTGISKITVDPRPRVEEPESEVMGIVGRTRFHHLSSTGALVSLTPSEESDGTRRLMDLAPLLFDLQQSGSAPLVHVLDEIDRSLHPLLTRFFLDTFLRTSSAEHPGQIIFTTHDTNLLDLNVLGRESIWFTEKDAGGASSLYSLAEFKGEQLDRLGGHLEEGYLQGRFGAIPFLGDARRLGWPSGG
jgi:uncharacterized protein